MSGQKIDLTTQSMASGPVSFDSQRITSLANPTALTDAVTATSLQNQTTVYNTDTGTANAYAVTLAPAPTSYVAGLQVAFVAANSNSGASTLTVGALATKALDKLGSTALASGDITAGQLIVAEYDGTRFQVISTLPSAGGSGQYVSQSFTSQTSVTVTHNFGEYPVVQVLDNTGAVFIPLTITNGSVNAFTTTFATSTTGTVIAVA